jgi:hypothetical protein
MAYYVYVMQDILWCKRLFFMRIKTWGKERGKGGGVMYIGESETLIALDRLNPV